jgi:hypothetical protein
LFRKVHQFEIVTYFDRLLKYLILTETGGFVHFFLGQEF